MSKKKIYRENKTIWAIVIAGILVLACALILFNRDETYDSMLIDEVGAETTKILLIGNSFLFTGRVGDQMIDIAKCTKPTRTFSVRQIAFPNYTLSDHFKRKTATSAIGQKPWNYVVIQDHSSSPFKRPKLLRQYVKIFDEEIDEINAETILFETWSDKDRQESYKEVEETYRHLAKETKNRLAPVGYAIHLSLSRLPDIELFSFDNHHLNDTGAYLVAATLYATIFEEQVLLVPEKMALSGVKIDRKVKESLNSIALEAIRLTDHSKHPEPEDSHSHSPRSMKKP
ncbi:MAG: SGNH/GDSL hydrolase family protein [Candidatus Obscuribacterales bacterium]|nr:SGNH/GDSL hydrolase family protein [Candidatus Obscuribacterales bacterium]